MKEEKFDDLIKKDINDQIKAPEKLKYRIKEEIERQSTKPQNRNYKVVKGIAAVFAVCILGVTSYAAITGNLNLKELGLQKASKNYENSAVEINKKIDNEYLTITLNNIACDNTYLISEYTLKLKDKGIKRYGEIKKYNGNYQIEMSSDAIINEEKIHPWASTVQKNAENEYKIFKIYNISDIKENEFNVKLQIENIVFNDGTETANYSQEDTSIDEFTEVNQNSINKEFSMDIERKNVEKTSIEYPSQKIGNKTIKIKDAANTNFETIVKASITEEKTYEEYKQDIYKQIENTFMLTGLNGENINYEVNKDFDSYAILDDGNYMKIDELRKYISARDENRQITVNSSEIISNNKEMTYKDLVNHYGTNAKIEEKVEKIEEDFIITIGIDQNGQDIEQIKLLPVEKTYLDDRNEEDVEYCKSIKWYKLENKKYQANSYLGGTLEISNIEITDQKIIFSCKVDGLIGEEQLIVMRKNGSEFNYVIPEEYEIKENSTNEYEITFNRKATSQIGVITNNDEEKAILDDISKDEFTMLFGKKNGTKFIGNGLELEIPEKITKEITIKNIKIEEFEEIKEENDDGLFEIIDLNKTNDTTTNSISEENDKIFQRVEERTNEILENTENKLNLIETNGKEFNKDEASIGGIKLGMERSKVRKILGKNPIEEQQDDYDEQKYEIYSDNMNISYLKENGKYYVTAIYVENGYETNNGIKIGDKIDNVIKAYAKDEKIRRIDVQDVQGLAIYGDKYYDKMFGTDSETLVQDGMKCAYCLVEPVGDEEIEPSIEFSYYDGNTKISYICQNDEVKYINLEEFK